MNNRLNLLTVAALSFILFCGLNFAHARSKYNTNTSLRRWTSYRRNYNQYFQNQYARNVAEKFLPTSQVSYIVGQANSRKARSNNVSSESSYQADDSQTPMRDSHKINDLEKLPFLNAESIKSWETKICRSCGVRFLQDSFCKDDFVLKVYIYNVTKTDNWGHQYLVYVHDIYKDTKNNVFMKLRLAELIYHCDKFRAGLEVYETYVLTGYYKDGKPYVDSCSWKKKSHELSFAQNRFLVRKYLRNCNYCSIERVLHYSPSMHREPGKCYVSVDSRSNEATCRDRYSICHFVANRHGCKFFETPRYEKCLGWLHR